MGAVLMPLPRVSRSHHLVDAEGIQLRKNPQYEERKHSLPFSPSANLQKLYYAPARCRFRFHSFFFRFARTVTISFSHRFSVSLSLSLSRFFAPSARVTFSTLVICELPLSPSLSSPFARLRPHQTLFINCRHLHCLHRPYLKFCW